MLGELQLGQCTCRTVAPLGMIGLKHIGPERKWLPEAFQFGMTHPYKFAHIAARAFIMVGHGRAMSIARQTFEFIDPGRLQDRSWSLFCQPRGDRADVAGVPSPVDAALHAGPGALRGINCNRLRAIISRVLRRRAMGVQPPAYTFLMRIRPSIFRSAIRYRRWVSGGSIWLRWGDVETLELYLGHIGYHVPLPLRGRRFMSACASWLFLPVASDVWISRTLWITTNPDNIASRMHPNPGRRFDETVAVLADNPLYQQGDRQKCRYRVDF